MERSLGEHVEGDLDGADRTAIFCWSSQSERLTMVSWMGLAAQPIADAAQVRPRQILITLAFGERFDGEMGAGSCSAKIR